MPHPTPSSSPPRRCQLGQASISPSAGWAGVAPSLGAKLFPTARRPVMHAGKRSNACTDAAEFSRDRMVCAEHVGISSPRSATHPPALTIPVCSGASIGCFRVGGRSGSLESWGNAGQEEPVQVFTVGPPLLCRKPCLLVPAGLGTAWGALRSRGVGQVDLAAHSWE